MRTYGIHHGTKQGLPSTCILLLALAVSYSMPPLGHAQDESYVQITAVSIVPRTVHKASNPREATISVQVMVHGEVAPNASARVDVATFSADPPENKVYYPRPSETVRLDRPLVVVEFPVQTSGDTVPGSVTIAADIYRVTGVKKVKRPESVDDWTAKVKTAVP